MYNEVMEAYQTIAQSRTNYQLDNFVIRQDTPERTWRQIVLELFTLSVALQKLEISVARLEDECRRLAQSADSGAKYDLAEKTIDLRVAKIQMDGAKREFEHLYSVFEQFPRYTPEALEAAEPVYWQRRLARQAQLDIDDRISGVGRGNLEALWQIGAIDKPGEHFIDKNPNMFKKLLGGS